MTKNEVLEFLKNDPDRWFSSREVSQAFPNLDTAKTLLDRLRHYGCVEYELRRIKGHRTAFWRYKCDMEHARSHYDNGTYSTAVFDAWKGVAHP